MIDSCSVGLEDIGRHLAESETLNPGQILFFAEFNPLASDSVASTVVAKISSGLS